ncbi:hypothetical protein MRX96_029964 [Rhipicephalus microplus]
MWASEQPGRLRLRWTSVQRATTCRRCRHGSSTIDCISLPAHASTHLPWSATWRLRCPGLYMRSSGNPPLTGHGGTVDMRLTNCPFIYNFQFVFGLLHQRRRCGPRNNRGDCDCAGLACKQRPRADAADTDLRLSTASAYRHMHPPICPGAPPGVCAVRDYICVPQETPSHWERWHRRHAAHKLPVHL